MRTLLYVAGVCLVGTVALVLGAATFIDTKKLKDDDRH